MTSRAQSLTEALGGVWDGSKGKALCPYHDDHHPSLEISQGRNQDVLAYCRACKEGVFERLVADGKVPMGKNGAKWLWNIYEPSPEELNSYGLRDALAILRAALKSGKCPDRYYRGRGLDCPPGAMLLSVDEATKLFSCKPYREVDGKLVIDWERGRPGRKRLLPSKPAAVMPIIGEHGLQAVSCAILTDDASTNEKRDGHSVRLFHGPMKGGYVKVTDGDIDPNKPLVTAEGIETARAAAQLSGHQAVAFLSTSNAASVQSPGSSELIVARDRDVHGRDAAKVLTERYSHLLPVRIAVPPKGCKDWNDALQSDLDRKVLKRRIVKAREAEKSDFKFVLTMGEFRQLSIPPATCLLKPILRLPGRSMISARSGSFKTRLALSMAYAAATGQDIMDWQVDRPYRVMFVDAELDPATLIEWLNRLGPNSPNLHVISDKYYAAYGIEQRVSLATHEDRQFLSERVYEIDPDIIFLDNYFELAPANMGDRENSEALWPEVRAWIEKHGKYERRHVMMLHHDNKSGGQFGSSHKERDFDLWVQLTKRKQMDTAERVAVEMSFRKSRHLNAVEEATRIMTLNTEGICEWQRSDDEITPGRPARNQERDKEIRRLHANGMSVAELMKKYDLKRRRVAQIIADGENATARLLKP